MNPRSILSALSVAAILFVAPLAGSAAEPVPAAEKLEALAKSASSAREHAQVAKYYRLQAEELSARAAEHEAKANRMQSGPRIGIAAKWPAMARNGWDRERQLAMQARRAAAESLARADHHIRLSVETELLGQ